MVQPDPEPIVFDVARPGVISARSDTSYTWFASRDSAETASIERAKS